MKSIEKLPQIFGNKNTGDEIPEGLIGAKIIRFGTPIDGSYEGGGLLIEYLPVGATNSKCAIFESNETGMWVGLVEEITNED